MVIGAGQAGLSVSYYLQRLGLDAGNDFVVLDRGPGTGGAWQFRWEALRIGSAHKINDLPGLDALGLSFETADRHAPAKDVVADYYRRYEDHYGLQVVRPADVVSVENFGMDLMVNFTLDGTATPGGSPGDYTLAFSTSGTVDYTAKTGTVTIRVRNNGTAAWDLDVTRLGTAVPQDRVSPFFVDGDWLDPTRATGTDARVEPGATGTFTFEVLAPGVREATMFDEGFQLVQDSTTWFGPEIHVVLNVVPAAEDTGCSAGGSAGWLLAFAFAPLLRRRRR